MYHVLEVDIEDLPSRAGDLVGDAVGERGLADVGVSEEACALVLEPDVLPEGLGILYLTDLERVVAVGEDGARQLGMCVHAQFFVFVLVAVLVEVAYLDEFSASCRLELLEDGCEWCHGVFKFKVNNLIMWQR